MTESTPEARATSFLQALDQLPPYAGLTMRGQPAGASFVRDGQSLVLQSFLATSRRAAVAAGEGAVALYAIWSRSGRSIRAFSAHPDEDEIVFRPGTALYLLETRRIADLDVRLVFEIELTPGFTLPDELPDELEAALQQALDAEEGQASRSGSTGKFVGDVE